jgi:pimeloyl-ACP methyl ester carboxylesterase
MLQRRHLSLDGLHVSFLEKGTAVAGQPSLVLLHGLMGTAATFAPLLESLPEGLHAVAVDFPGAGSSERRKNLDATMGATAVTVLRLLDALDLDRPCLLGHSHGAAVALRLARTCPERLRSLVLLGPAHPYFQESDPIIRFYLSLPGRLFAHSMPWYPRWVQMMGLRRMAGPQSWDTSSRLKPYRDNLRTPGTISHLLRLLRTWHADMAELRRLLCEPVTLATLILWGEADRAVPVRAAGAYRALGASCASGRWAPAGGRASGTRCRDARRVDAGWGINGAQSGLQPECVRQPRSHRRVHDAELRGGRLRHTLEEVVRTFDPDDAFGLGS